MDTHRIALSLLPAAAGRPFAPLLRALLGSVVEAPLAHRGVWLNQHRLLDPTDPALLAPPQTLVVVHRPPAGSYATLTLAASDICYEDAWLLALNKHAGWYTSMTPWDIEGHVQHALAHYLQARDGATPPLHPIHRLDRDTSGLLLFTRNPAANSPLQAAFASRTVEKSYLALCAGAPPHDTWVQQSGHGQMRGGRWRLYPLEAVGTTLPGGGRIKHAHTSFVVLKRSAEAALVRATPHTGRTHQIRLHMAAAGLPLLGDERYGGPTTFRGTLLTGHLLHAERMRLRHPISEQSLELFAPLPDWVVNFEG